MSSFAGGPKEGAINDSTSNDSINNGDTAPANPAFRISRVAIIGAGPSGLAAAKYLLAEGFSADKIDIYEQQAEVGGVWNYHDAVASPDIPQTDAHPGLETPVYPDNSSGEADGGGRGGAEEDEREDDEEEEKDEYEDYVFDSDDEACTAPGSGACSLPPITSPPSRKEDNHNLGKQDDDKKESHVYAHAHVHAPPPIFPNPMYYDLHTNIPHTLMQFSDLGFTSGEETGGGVTRRADCEIFPSRQVVLEYLRHYAQDVRHLVRFSTQVTDVSLSLSLHDQNSITENENQQQIQPLIREKWLLKSKNLLTATSQTEEVETYDAVVVASGHYSTPYIPVVPVDTPAAREEMRAFAAAHPGVLSHAKSYRTATSPSFKGKRVVVVGSGPSALDIAAQISAVCAPPLVISARSPLSAEMAGHLGVGDGENGETRDGRNSKKVRVVGPIKKFLVEERGIVVGPAPAPAPAPSTDDGNKGDNKIENESEKEEEQITLPNIDAIIFCTGYLYTYPFLSSLTSSPLSSSSSPPLITTGRRVHNLARHFLHIEHPTLVFPGLPIKVIPFPLVEAQAAVFSRLWSNRLPLPSRSVLESWVKEDEEGKGLEGDRVAKAGSGDSDKAFHLFSKGGDARYINALHDWALQARSGEKEGEGGKGKGKGKDPPYWGDEQLWQRVIYAQAKMRFEKTGRKAKTLEELGFRYEKSVHDEGDAPAETAAVPSDIAG